MYRVHAAGYEVRPAHVTYSLGEGLLIGKPFFLQLLYLLLQVALKLQRYLPVRVGVKSELLGQGLEVTFKLSFH